MAGPSNEICERSKDALQCTTLYLVSFQSVLRHLTTCDAEIRPINTELEPLICVELLEAELETALQIKDGRLTRYQVLKQSLNL